MPKLITFLLAAALGAGVPLGFAGPVAASARSSKKQFCAAVSNAGGATTFSKAALSGQGASGVATSLQKLSKLATTKHLKSDLTTLAAVYRRVGHGNVGDLGSKDVTKFDAALTDFGTYVAANCASTTSPSSPSSTGSAAVVLSGTWSGQYSGPSQGTFTLTWQQSGSKLTGTIAISELGNTPSSIDGTVTGNTITFGTVGTAAVTYSGTVSGNSMSGTYQSPTGNGTWTATKTS